MKTIQGPLITILMLIVTINAVSQEKGQYTWNGHQCAVALTYDDGLNVHLDLVAPTLDSAGLKATFYIPGNALSLRNRLNDWRTLAKNGHELGNHTLFHPCAGDLPGREWVNPDYDLSTYTMKRMLDEIRLANTLLQSIDGRTKRTFAYTCGEEMVEGMSLNSEIAEDFVGARGVVPKTMEIGEVVMFDIGAFMVSGQTGEALIAMVEKARKDFSLIVFIFHGVGGEHAINVDLAEHNKLLRYLKENERDIWVATMADIAEFVMAHQMSLERLEGHE
ncbi:MAG: polysaccharide deacetylase family protein [Bacteroidetes bacterium]|nr:polysaccharide deacetylase family protein [Bacteroidota bacterium]